MLDNTRKDESVSDFEYRLSPSYLEELAKTNQSEVCQKAYLEFTKAKKSRMKVSITASRDWV